MPLVPGDESAELEEPGEEAFDLPPASISPEGATILGLPFSGGSMRCYELNAVRGQILVQRITVVSSVPDQTFGELSSESLSERGLDASRFMSLTTSKPHGDRKARAVCHCHDLGRSAAGSWPHRLDGPAKRPNERFPRRALSDFDPNVVAGPDREKTTSVG